MATFPLTLWFAVFEPSEAKHGRTLINVTIASSTLRPLPVLAISLSDAPKRSSARAIRALREKGIKVNLLTGDARETAVVVAQQVGIEPEDVWAGMSPKGKATVVTELVEREGSSVAMVRVFFFVDVGLTQSNSGRRRYQRLTGTRGGYCRHCAFVGDVRGDRSCRHCAHAIRST